jgi:NADPH:quinone reductase-like Zn-dependent oxidoreductase
VAQIIVEMAGGENVRRSIQAIVPGGRISMIGLLESDELSVPILPLLRFALIEALRLCRDGATARRDINFRSLAAPTTETGL